MFSAVRPNQWVALRLPSDNVKVEQMIPNATIHLGKFGSFRTNHVINRPFYTTWEIIEKSGDRPDRELRMVKASELHADTLLEEAESDIVGEAEPNAELDEYGLLNGDKSNVNIFDDTANQKLTMEEIESLKADEMSNPRELIGKIMASHSKLDQKTAFSLAKYTLRKQKKYMKRFTILPLDVSMMTDWMMNERDFAKIMEVRNETLGLLGSWANVHAAGTVHGDEAQSSPQCRYLVVDDTGGLIVATLAERMGILHHDTGATSAPETTEAEDNASIADEANPGTTTNPHKHRRIHDIPLPKSNTIHLVHSNQQPNLSLLRFFNFDSTVTPNLNDPSPPHPLYAHLKSISWLQLVDPMCDSTYQEPPMKSPEELHDMKTNARSAYYRKRRRWERCKSVVDETKAGGFDGLVIATYTDPLSILHQLVPLLTGGAQIVVYHPSVEPLNDIFDAYSTARRTAFLNLEEHEKDEQLGTSKFPVDPSLTLGFTVQTVRARKWQVLPGRTHPLMMGRGGAEGYIAAATKVLPLKGKIMARGKSNKRGKRGTTNGDATVLGNEANSSSGEEESESKRVKIGSDLDEVDTLDQESRNL